MSEKHKVFVSYHHENDEEYRKKFELMFGTIYVSKSVDIGDIDPNLNTETVRRKIREDYLGDTSVTVVLVGTDTWKRKHVDWEISASIRKTKISPRSGLLGIILPAHSDYGKHTYTSYLIPPRLHDNIECRYARIYDWSNNSNMVKNWIHQAFLRRDKIYPNNKRLLFARNRSGDRWYD
ncbi:MAG: TIR domain-containing protein [Candidatus Odinarchaeota archaeon]